MAVLIPIHKPPNTPIARLFTHTLTHMGMSVVSRNSYSGVCVIRIRERSLMGLLRMQEYTFAIVICSVFLGISL